MANLSKLKRRTLGAPPPPEEASRNLTAPELAPGEPASPPDAAVMPLRRPENAGKPLGGGRGQGRIDGRSLRRSGRLIPLATRVSPEFDERLRKIAQRDGLLLVEVLERGLDAYEGARRQEIAAR